MQWGSILYLQYVHSIIIRLLVIILKLSWPKLLDIFFILKYNISYFYDNLCSINLWKIMLKEFIYLLFIPFCLW